MEKPNWTAILGAFLFGASGFAAVVFEVAWERMLGILSGVHAHSITLIVAAYMAGLGLGSLAGGRLSDRLGRRTSVWAFFACEAGIGAMGMLSPWLYHDVGLSRLAPLGQYPLALPAAQFMLLLPPTLLMGASLPLLSKGLVPDHRSAARIVASLYGTNTLGAALGALGASWWWIGAYGLAGSVRRAAAIDFGVALLALPLARFLPRAGVAEADAVVDEAPAAAGSRPAPFGFGAWCTLFGYAGFLALSMELLWLRTLSVTMKSTSYSFGHVLGLFLAMLGLGGLVGGLLAPRLRRPARMFLWGQWGAATTAVLLVVALSRIPPESLSAYWRHPKAIETNELIYALEHHDPAKSPRTIGRFVEVYVYLPLGLLALPTFLAGCTFAAVQRAVQTDLRHLGRRLGGLLASNILGAILGALATGFVLLDALGTAGTWRLIGLGSAIFTVIALGRASGARGKSLAVAAGTVSLLLAAAVPSTDRFWASFHGAPPEQVVVAEDAAGVAAVHTRQPTLALLKLNGRTNGVFPYGEERTLYGLIPAMMHPAPRDAAVIGLGTGNTAWAIGAAATLGRIDVYELTRTERTLLERFEFGGRSYPPLRSLLADGRFHLHLADGRRGIRLSSLRYDLIEADAAKPSMAYSGNLYSREFFELCRARLKAGGLFCSMAPSERTLRTMVTVFPYVVDFHGRDFASFIVGSETPVTLDRATILERLREDSVRRYLGDCGAWEETEALVLRYLDQVEARVIAGDAREPFLAGDVNTDLFPRDEFDARHAGTYH